MSAGNTDERKYTCLNSVGSLPTDYCLLETEPMPCCTRGYLTICAPSHDCASRHVFRCRKCKRRRLHLVLSYEWYGSDAFCLTCSPKHKTVKNKKFELPK